MERARSRDVSGVSEVIYDMIAAGISPGPRSFHALVVSNTLNGDHEGAVSVCLFVAVLVCMSVVYVVSSYKNVPSCCYRKLRCNVRGNCRKGLSSDLAR